MNEMSDQRERSTLIYLLGVSTISCRADRRSSFLLPLRLRSTAGDAGEGWRHHGGRVEVDFAMSHQAGTPFEATAAVAESLNRSLTSVSHGQQPEREVRDRPQDGYQP